MVGKIWVWQCEASVVRQGRIAPFGPCTAGSRGVCLLHASLLVITSRQQQKPCTGLISEQHRDCGERDVSSAGLSGAVYTSLYVGFLQPDTLRLLLFIAIVPTAVVLAAACFVNHVPFVQAKEAAAPTGEMPASHDLLSCKPQPMTATPQKALSP